MPSILVLLYAWFAFSDGQRLVVVAPETFHPALGDFIAFKQKRIPTTLVSLEKTLRESEGADDPERLKRHLYREWSRRGITHVLLVGDADILPVRFMVLDRCTAPAFDYAFYPSDLYYADLAKPDGRFDDWNARKEGFHARYFGEVRGEKNKEDPINYDAVDYRPDVAVGRWPVSTSEEVTVVASKTMRYEEGIESGTFAGARRVGLFCVDGWVDTRGFLDGLAEKLAGWTVEKRYYADAKRNDGTPPPDGEQAIAMLNEGARLICHSGHGSDNEWGGCLSVGMLQRVTNSDRLPVLFSIGCSTARFSTLPPYDAYVDEEGVEHAGSNGKEVFEAPPPPPAPYQRGRHNPTGLGEQLLRRGPNGAVAYIGCNTGSQPCAMSLLEGFVTALAESKARSIGDCWSRAVAFYYDRERLATIVPTKDWYPASIFFQGMKFMLYGDPSLPIAGE